MSKLTSIVSRVQLLGQLCEQFDVKIRPGRSGSLLWPSLKPGQSVQEQRGCSEQRQQQGLEVDCASDEGIGECGGGTYRKVQKISEARKLSCNLPKIQTKRPYLKVFSQKDANE